MIEFAFCHDCIIVSLQIVFLVKLLQNARDYKKFSCDAVYSFRSK
uniref:Uncharacterized protein n=1 Tax=Arundo donax TaxID=35708 RepID=A0A0A9DLY3_ARUDO